MFSHSFPGEETNTENMSSRSGIVKKRQPPKTGSFILPKYGPKHGNPEEWDLYRSTHVHSADPMGIPVASSTAVPCAISVPPRSSDLGQIISGLRDPKTMIVNVREPWCSMIAAGIKDIENRPDALPCEWVVFVASKVNYSRLYWCNCFKDIRRRLTWNGIDGASPQFPDFEGAQEVYKLNTSQRALCLARVKSLENESADPDERRSIWNNGEKFAWKILEVVKFPEPVFFGRGTLGKRYLNGPTFGRPEFVDELEQQIRRVVVA